MPTLPPLPTAQPTRPPALRARGRTPWLPLGLVGASVFLLSGLSYYHLALAGSDAGGGWTAGVVAGLYQFLGFVPGFMLGLLALAWGTIWFLGGSIERPGARLLRIVVLTISLAVLVNLEGSLGALQPHDGVLGHWLASRFVNVFGFGLSAVLVSLVALASLLLATDFFFYRHFDSLAAPAAAAPATSSARIGDAGVEPEATAMLRGLREDLRAVEQRTVWSAPLDDEEPLLPRQSAAELEVGSEGVGPELAAAEPAVEEPAVEEAVDVHAEAAPEPAVGEVDGEWGRDVREIELPELLPDEQELAAAVEEFMASLAPAAPAGPDSHGSAPSAPSAPSEPLGEGGAELLPDAASVGPQDLDDEAPRAPEQEAASPAQAGSADADVELDAVPEPETVVPLPRAATVPAARQGTLFLRGSLDPDLLAEATQVVRHAGRATAALLQRRLRIGYDDAIAVLDALRTSGILDGEPGSSTAHVRADGAGAG